VLTHRYTRNSRGPGQDGMPVTITPGREVTCPKCQQKRLAGDGPHAPRLTARGRVDCVGDRIDPNGGTP
jgi:hypothetical protein